MLRSTRRATAAALVLAAGALALSAGPATAEPVFTCNTHGFCRIVVGTPGKPGQGQPVQPVANHPGGPGVQHGPGPAQDGAPAPAPAPGVPDPFTYTPQPDGSTRRCLANPPAGGQFSTGALTCLMLPLAPPVAPPGPVAPGQAAPPAAPAITPAQLAQMAVSQLKLTAPGIGIVPEPGPTRIGLVGMPVWMWTRERTWTPLTATAAVPGVAVTATAKIDHVDWDMGDGAKVTCRGPGTVYQDTFDKQSSPDCGYRYLKSSANKPNQAFTVTATATWAITWAGADNGAMTATTTAAVAIRVGELQVLITS